MVSLRRLGIDGTGAFREIAQDKRHSQKAIRDLFANKPVTSIDPDCPLIFFPDLEEDGAKTQCIGTTPQQLATCQAHIASTGRFRSDQKSADLRNALFLIDAVNRGLTHGPAVGLDDEKEIVVSLYVLIEPCGVLLRCKGSGGFKPDTRPVLVPPGESSIQVSFSDQAQLDYGIPERLKFAFHLVYRMSRSEIMFTSSRVSFMWRGSEITSPLARAAFGQVPAAYEYMRYSVLSR